MRPHCLHLIAIVLLLAVAVPSSAQSKQEKRYAYTMRMLHLDKATEARFGPVLRAYLKEKKEASSRYDSLKEKYKAAIKAGTLTDAQATQLLEARWQRDEAELAVKRKYHQEFLRYLKPKTVFRVFDYVNDKMSKIEG